ncbi:MAG TPA: PEP/pyruvate-binding domain-containing protein [Candidatus Lokiarchaeia archaeon]|nr:PEP/pyruvate-binding domain-containing protein [Candidatus Lokiarchaeia archaeon]
MQGSKTKNETAPSTGIPGLDVLLDGIRPGDNLVWLVDHIDDYVPFVHEFCKNVITAQTPLIYFRFASHEPLLPPGVDAVVRELDPSSGFESFLNEILTTIETYGRGACYVFDCLSELVSYWYSDVMLGNFFQLTCPYLYDFDTATYFAVFRNHHSSQVIDAIMDTAQIIIDVFHTDEHRYIQPLKVFRRHSPTMYMLHEMADDQFIPITRSGEVSEFSARVKKPWFDLAGSRLDTWQLTFLTANEIIARSSSEIIPEEEASALKITLLHMIIAREKRVSDLAKEYLDLEDLVAIGKRIIGTGLIGGKSVGMLIAQAVLKKRNPELAQRLEMHDSFYIGSDVYYSFLVKNKAWWGRKRVSNPATFLENLDDTKIKILEGKFPHDIMVKFANILDYYGQSPIIVRSSSLLEDAYGNAFAGKYVSIFCPNQGTPDQRLDNFINAVKTIYASTINEDALTYRKSRALLEKDEQMALLVMRVSGDVYGNYFFPQVAGVGYSFNPYAWDKSIDPRAGLLRLVFGLGTRAVERKDDYTRLIALNAPTERILKSDEGIKKYSQHRVDMLNLQDNSFASPYFYKIAPELKERIPFNLFSSSESFLTFDGMLNDTAFAEDMRQILKILDVAYENPVDVEFTANFSGPDDYKINILQCRPLQVKRDVSIVTIPENIAEEDLIFTTAGPIIGNSVVMALDLLVYVESSKYGQMNDRDRYEVARLIGKITHHESLKGKKIAIVGCGRWGTSTPSLGIPVSFSEINTVSIVGEIAEMHGELIPDVSLGTHFFNDLVEMDMTYFAIFPSREGNLIKKDFFAASPNHLEDYVADPAPWIETIYVVEANAGEDATGVAMYMNVMDQRGFCYVTHSMA